LENIANISQEAYTEYYFKCCIEVKGLLKVIGSQVHCKSGNNLEMMQDRDAVTRDH